MKGNNHIRWLLCAAACLLAALVYLNTIHGDFLWDDLMLVRDNPYIKHPTHLHHLVQKTYYSVFRELTYRPVCTLTYFGDFALWGLNPKGFHITNIVLHILNVLLLFIFARRLSGRYETAFVAAVLFAVHPVHSEAVAGITFREDALCLLFVFLSLNFYLSARSEKFREWKWIVLSLFSFFLAVFSKETAVVLPAVILMLELCVPATEKSRTRKLFVLSGYTAAAAGYLVFRLFLFRNPSEHWVYHGRSFLQTMNLVPSALLQYFKLLIFPVKQCVQYMPSDISYGIWGCLFALFLLFLLLLFYFKFRDVLFGLIWFLLFLLPVSNIIPIGVIMAERYLYIPNAGFFLFVSQLYGKTFKNNDASAGRRIINFSIILLIIGLLGALTVYRNETWRDESVFWKEAASCSPLSAIAHNNLGLVYLNNGDITSAESSFNKAIQLADSVPLKEDRYQVSNRAHVNLGIVYARQNRMRDARHEFETAIRVAPGYVRARLNLAVLFMETGKMKEAVAEFNVALALEPDNLRARLYLAHIYLKLGEFENAETEVEKILEIDPKNGEALALLKIIQKMKPQNKKD